MQIEEALVDDYVEDNTVINSQPRNICEDEHNNSMAAPPT